jgi:hypothetical protein
VAGSGTTSGTTVVLLGLDGSPCADTQATVATTVAVSTLVTNTTVPMEATGTRANTGPTDG